MNTKKDYSLLRPFDLEAAKRGELICWFKNGVRAEYVGECGMSNENDICVKYVEGDGCAIAGTFVMNESRYYRMAPLAWVEGKPVYKGDVLYLIDTVDDLNKQPLKVEANSDRWWCRHPNGAVPSYPEDRLTWNPPKVKREGWINIYPDANCSCIYPTEGEADCRSNTSRIACIRVEWEQ